MVGDMDGKQSSPKLVASQMSSTAPRRTYGWRTYGDAIRELGLGAMLGIIILIIEHGASDRFPEMSGIIRNAILGTCAIGVARALETALSWAIEQSRIPTMFRTIIYAVGAWIGYFAGVRLAWMIFGRE